MATDLITKLEEAGEGSRELDRLIGEATDSPMGWSGDVVGLGYANFTTSLDVALALAERLYTCWAWSVGQNIHHGYWLAYALTLAEDRSPVQATNGTARTPALALCAAILRASEEKQS